MGLKETLRDYYRQERVTPLQPIPGCFLSNRDLFGVTSCSKGLGDTVMLMDLPRAAFQSHRRIQVYSNAECFGDLAALNPFFRFDPSKQYRTSGFVIDAPAFVRQYDCGAGHMLQRLRRVFGFPVDPIPRAFIKSELGPQTGRVAVHIDPGKSSIWQQAYLKRTRHLLPECVDALDKLESLRKDLEFRHITRDVCPNVDTLVTELAGCEYFIGINSGPMHIATALGLKVICILSYPDPEHVMLPVLKDFCTHDAEFLAPQNVHLHQYPSSNPLCPSFTLRTLNEALDGKVYPYWDNSLVADMQSCSLE